MNQETQGFDQLFGCTVLDPSGNSIGKVDGVWVDDATAALEFISVKVGTLMGKSHIIPVAQREVDSTGGVITVPYAENLVKDAPSFGSDDELSPQDENEMYQYYGIDRSMGQSPTGLPGGAQAGTYVADEVGTREYTGTDTGERSMQLAEEQLQVGKQQVEAGRVRLRKVVHTERREVPVELRREDVRVERIDARGMDVPDTAFQEEEIEVPVMREEAVVGKETRVTGGVRVDKSTEVETRTVGGEVRKEDVEVVEDSGLER